MKIGFDKKNLEVKYIPEQDNDIFRLGRAVERNQKGRWRYEFVSGKMTYVSFGAIDLFNMILAEKQLNENPPT